MTVRDYIRLLRRHWIVVLCAFALGLAASGVGSYLMKPQFQAQARLFVSTQAGQTNADLMQGGSFTQQRVQSYADVATSPQVLQPVIDELHLKETSGQLARRVTAQAPTDTVIITLSVTDPKARQAATVADAVAKSLVQAIGQLERPATGPSPVKATIIEHASTPRAPVSPNIPLNLALGTVLGLLIGIGIGLLRETLDTRIRTEEDLKGVTEATHLGGVPFDKDATDQPIVANTNPHGLRAEALRQVRTNLQFVDATNHPTSILVTSSLPGEGKSSTSVNLAITMAEAGARVCLIEADLRRPKAVSYLGLEGGVGLTTALIGEATLDDVLQPWGGETGTGSLTVLASGVLPPNPSELLGSDAMHALLTKLEADFDAVIIDAPPLLPVTDASVLAQRCDGVIVIVGSGRVDTKGLALSLDNLEKVDARVLGVVLNRMPLSNNGGYNNYRYSYSYSSQSPAGKTPRGKSLRGRKSSKPQPARAGSSRVQVVKPPRQSGGPAAPGRPTSSIGSGTRPTATPGQQAPSERFNPAGDVLPTRR